MMDLEGNFIVTDPVTTNSYARFKDVAEYPSERAAYYEHSIPMSYQDMFLPTEQRTATQVMLDAQERKLKEQRNTLSYHAGLLFSLQMPIANRKYATLRAKPKPKKKPHQVLPQGEFLNNLRKGIGHARVW